MTLFNITFKNIRRNIYNYFMYFASMVFTIMIYFTFVAINDNPQVTDNLNENFNILLNIGSVFIAIFAVIFMWYSSTFFIRKRKKEIGLYSLLGLEKRQIARMLFYENIVMGIFALVIGVALGTLFSKMFVMILLNLMGFFVNVDFFISFKAMIETAMVFAVIFFVLALHSYTVIYRFKLVDLFSADRKVEKPVGEHKGSLVIAVISIALIGLGYKFAVDIEFLNNNFYLYGPVVISLVVLGTFLFFSSFTYFVVKLQKKNVKNYYKGMNMVSTSNLLFKIKSNSRMLGTIATLCAVTMTAVGLSACLYYGIMEDVNSIAPFTYSFYYNDDMSEKDISDFDNEIDRIISTYPDHEKSFSFKKSSFSTQIEYQWKYGNTGHMEVLSLSDYNKIAKIRDLEEISSINSGDIIITKIGPQKLDMSKINVDTSEKDFVFNISEIKDISIMGTISTFPTGIISDSDFNEVAESKEITISRFIEVDDKYDAYDQNVEIIEYADDKNIYVNGLPVIYQANMQMRGMFMFVGSFLGLVILVSTGSIIYFRQVMEASYDVERFRIIKNIGVSRKDVKKSIAKQVMFMFLFPLVIGISHSSVALYALSLIFSKNFLVPIMITILIYTLIYFIYYVVTVISYNKIVNEE